MCVLPGVVEDGDDGSGELVLVLPLLSPFRPLRRGGREGAPSGAFFLLRFSGRPRWRGEEPVVVRVPLLVVLVVEVFFSGVSAPAGLGGEGSGGWRWSGVGGGGPGRRRLGWRLGGVGVQAL